MLCDQFDIFRKSSKYALASPGLKRALEHIGDRVKNAPRFNLTREATLMVSNLSTIPYENITSALAVCRLPHPRMFVEFAFRDRSDWLKEASAHGHEVSDHPDAAPPLRLGFLIEADGPTQIVVQPVWMHYQDWVDASRKRIRINLSPEKPVKPDDEQFKRDLLANPAMMKKRGFSSASNIDAFLELSNRVSYEVPSYFETFWTEMFIAGGDKMLAEENARSNFDLASEWRFVLCLLILLNSRNLYRYGEEENLDKLNKSRIKSGKPPRLTHRDIVLSLSKVQKARIARGYYDRRAPNSACFVMGHFKVRKSGVFWWSPHSRGGHPDAPRSYKVTE